MSQDKKRDAIIEAALKRFAHFGVAKTTMTEIGNDLAISKASLYYYFPDKINLYAAVLKSIAADSDRNNSEALEAQPDPFRAMDMYLERRTDFIIKYYNILAFLKSKTGIPEELAPVFQEFKDRELRQVKNVVLKGVKIGVFNISDPEPKAALLYDCLEGLRTMCLDRAHSFFPDKEEFLQILRKEQEFSHIFLKGLTCF